jgi:hypothetical protein
MTALKGKQAELKLVLDKLAALDADLQEKRQRKERYSAILAIASVEDAGYVCQVYRSRCSFVVVYAATKSSHPALTRLKLP